VAAGYVSAHVDHDHERRSDCQRGELRSTEDRQADRQNEKERADELGEVVAHRSAPVARQVRVTVADATLDLGCRTDRMSATTKVHLLAGRSTAFIRPISP
jgi:hypothetical protein